MAKKADRKISIIGAGNMGEAFIRGMIRQNFCSPSDISVSDLRGERLELMNDTYHVKIFKNNRDCVEAADVVVLAVKPQNMDALLTELAAVEMEGKLIISIAAGVPISRITDAVGGDVGVVRVMPNTPALVGEGMSVWASGGFVTEGDVEFAREILTSLGREMEVKEELMDAATAVSGSGPAYFFYLAEIMEGMAEKHGFTGEQAMRLVAQTMIGAGRLMDSAGEKPAELKRRVASPGGTTEAALKVFEKRRVGEAIREAIEAARGRAGELSAG